MSGNFFLKWNDFQSKVSQSFDVLRREEDFFDVTLVSEDETQIPAHKLVLSASSDFFKNILRRNTHSHPLLYLSGVDSVSLGSILDFIYQGEVQIYQNGINQFMEAAKKLKIEGLMGNNEEYLKNGEYSEVSHNSNLEYPELYNDNLKLSKDSQDIEVLNHKSRIKNVVPGPSPESESAFNIKEESNVDEESREEVPVSGENVMKKKRWKRNSCKQKVVRIHDMSKIASVIEKLMWTGDGVSYCSVCPYMSQSKAHMREHVETHIEGLSYLCEVCQQTFNSSQKFRRHWRGNSACDLHYRKYKRFFY